MPRVMGILNVTPDSFSDGGQFSHVDRAIAHGLELRNQGADIVDVGGESTRPGAERVPPAQEQQRVIPVIEALAAEGVTVSIDTMNAETAVAAAKAGASIINDVSGGLADPEMYRTVAETDLFYIAMHWRGHSSEMASLANYTDVVTDVRAELKDRLVEMMVWGINPDRVVLDPGLGFAKSARHNWALLARLDELSSLGCPILIGASRKRFLGKLLPADAAITDRDLATAVISNVAAQAHVWGVRVHDVASTQVALSIYTELQKGKKR
ncbi:dihydropteroate synthase [Salinibacterium sp. M195]|uniref:dihydropteroate synthase n=1 Tax=Salinibacterium sp. M195 TaxID=2583374 RepID=UPI0021072261|nr:dihydropteroate synthase [Salinibacterium sp. M195]QYH37102.1 dihydropteroate synthase [Salinibacterium sp. M195]